jgi:mitogen-activated protein kinase 15
MMWQALAHPYMKAFSNGQEPTCPGTLSIPIDDDHKFTVNDYREKLYQQVCGVAAGRERDV